MSLPMFLLRAFAVWLLIIGVETVHGILRTLLLVPLMGDFPARQVAVFTGSLLIFGVAYLFIRWIKAGTTLRLVAVGLMWVVLTVLFEIGLGRLVLDLPWERLTEDYDITRGGFLGIGLLFLAATPLLAASSGIRTVCRSQLKVGENEHETTAIPEKQGELRLSHGFLNGGFCHQ